MELKQAGSSVVKFQCWLRYLTPKPRLPLKAYQRWPWTKYIRFCSNCQLSYFKLSHRKLFCNHRHVPSTVLGLVGFFCIYANLSEINTLLAAKQMSDHSFFLSNDITHSRTLKFPFFVFFFFFLRGAGRSSLIFFPFVFVCLLWFFFACVYGFFFFFSLFLFLRSET